MPETKRNIYEELSAPLPIEAKQVALNKDTHKGYDTTGQGYQYHVDRFNQVLGVTGWTWAYTVFAEDVEKYSSGKPKYIYTVDVSITIKENSELELKEDTRHCIGGHDAISRADALKGAITNGFKKTAAFFGVGREAYAGELDEDNQPNPDREDKNNGSGKPQAPKPEPPKSKSTPPPEPPKKDIPKPASTPKKVDANTMERIKKAAVCIGEITSNKILGEYKLKSIDFIQDDQTANNVLKDFVSAYRKAVGV